MRLWPNAQAAKEACGFNSGNIIQGIFYSVVEVQENLQMDLVGNLQNQPRKLSNLFIKKYKLKINQIILG